MHQVWPHVPKHNQLQSHAKPAAAGGGKKRREKNRQPHEMRALVIHARFTVTACGAST